MVSDYFGKIEDNQEEQHDRVLKNRKDRLKESYNVDRVMDYIQENGENTMLTIEKSVKEIVCDLIGNEIQKKGGIDIRKCLLDYKDILDDYTKYILKMYRNKLFLSEQDRGFYKQKISKELEENLLDSRNFLSEEEKQLLHYFREEKELCCILTAANIFKKEIKKDLNKELTDEQLDKLLEKLGRLRKINENEFPLGALKEYLDQEDIKEVLKKNNTNPKTLTSKKRQLDINPQINLF